MAIFLIVLSLTALGTAAMMASAMRRAIRAKHWPQHAARVLHIEVRRKHAKYGWLHYVHIRYEYSVGSRREVSCFLPSFLGTDHEAYAMRLASFFHHGASVPVYVDPCHPDRATLLPGVDGKEWGCSCLHGPDCDWSADCRLCAVRKRRIRKAQLGYGA